MKITSCLLLCLFFCWALGLAQPVFGDDSFVIEIMRKSKSSGNLKFIVNGTESFETKCWWDASNEIPAKRYSGCSTTTMASKKLHAVYLPDRQTGRKGIFIHQGTGPKHSAGCIVINKKHIEQIFAAVPPNREQIVVVIADKR